MTINSTTRLAGPFTGNGITTAFPFSFKVFKAEDVLVVKRVGDVETVLVLNTDYTITLNSDQNSNPGGTVNSTPALPSGQMLAITSRLDYLQPTDLTNQGGFYPKVITDALDRLTIFAQQLDVDNDRSIKLDITDPRTPEDLLQDIFDTEGNAAASAAASAASAGQAATSAGQAATSAGQAATSAANASTALQNTLNALAQAQDGIRDRFVPGTNFTPGTTTSLTLSQLPAKSGAVFVFIGGVYQVTTEWALVGQAITFTAPLPNAVVEIRYFTPSQFVGLNANDLAVLGAAQAAAQASAVISSAAATAASLSAVSAQAAATAALAAARTYATTAAGIAATTSGQVFLVTTVDPQVFDVYSNNAGTAALIGTLNIADGTLLRSGDTDPHAFVLADEDGNIAFAIGRNGEVKTKLLELTAPFKPKSELNVDVDGGLSTTIFSVETQSTMLKYAVADEQGNVILGVDAMGRLVANFELAPIPQLPNVFKTGGTYDYDINHVFTYGQSLSVGQALPIQSPTQKYDNLMFFRGQRPQYDYPNEAPAVWYQSLIPSYEFVSPTEPSLGETPSAGTGDMIKERVLAEDGKAFTDHTYQILTSAPGFGARTIAQLSKGSEHFSRMVEQVGFGLSLSNALGKTYAVQAVTWTQGESDYLSGTSRAAYLASFNQLAADIQTDLKTASGQSKAIPVISYQVATHKTGNRAMPTIALAQLDAEAANPLIYIATPMYHLPYQDGFHLTGVGSKWLGGYYGLAYKRIVIDGIDWKPLKPISAVRQSSIIELRFNVPSGRLVFDTTQVSANTNMGFELVDSTGAALTISSVAIVDYDRVRIVASAPVPAGAKVRYAWSGAGNFGPVNGPRGNLRDTQGDDIVFDPNGINKRMDNWCVIFEMGV